MAVAVARFKAARTSLESQGRGILDQVRSRASLHRRLDCYAILSVSLTYDDKFDLYQDTLFVAAQ